MTEASLTGVVVADRYELGALLGAGGMGEVYRARDRRLGVEVALKVVLPGELGPRLIPRIMREARLASRLHHPHVVPVLDHGRWGEPRDRVYLTMELVEGVPLTELMRAPMAPGPACALASQLLSALAHVHARGVLHRDIKPDNVLVSRGADGSLRARLADFGIARALDADAYAEQTRLTHDGLVLGTPRYMAPEQIEGRGRLGPPADLYAVGLLLYELLGARLPFDGPLRQILFDKLSKDPEPLAVALPPGLSEVVLRLIARRPEDRFVLAADALEALSGFVEPVTIAEPAWRALRGERPAPKHSTDSVTLSGTVEEGAADARRLAGREPERARLEALAGRAEGGEGAVCVLTGEAGIGKSALLESVAIDLNEAGRFFVLRSRSAPGAGVASALAAALEDWLGTRGLPRDAVEATVRGSLARAGELDAADLSELMALLRPDAGGGPDARRASATFIRTLRRLSGERPAVAILDDLEPDAGTAAFIELALFELELEPFAALIAVPLRAVRPGDPVHATLARSARSEGGGRHVLELAPLALDALATHLERAHRLPPHVAERVARRAEGNPLFAQHLAAMEDWHGVDVYGRTAPAGAPSSELPSPLRVLLEASLAERLARLAERERAERVLVCVAVLGAHVDLELLEAFVDDGERAALDDDLDALIDAELLADAGRDEIAFAHRLLRDAVLSSVSPRKRRRLHARAAELREARSRPDEQGAIGDHWAAAGEPARAAEAWLAGHAWAERTGQPGRAVGWGLQALAVLPEDDARRGALSIAVGRALRNDAQLAEAEALLDPLVEDADADVALAAVELLAEIAQERSDSAIWRARIEAGRPRRDEAGPRGRSALLRAEAFFANMHGDLETGIEAAREALRLAEDHRELLTATRRLTFACLSQGRAEEARAVAASTLARLGSAGRELMPEVLRMQATSDLNAGRFEAAAGPLRELVELHRRAGRMANRVAVMVDYAAVLAMMGRFEDSLGCALETHALATRFALEIEAERALGNIVIAEVGAGRPARALARVRDRPTPNGEVNRRAHLLIRALPLAATGSIEEARALLPSALGHLPPVPYFDFVLSMLADTLLERGAADVAAPVLDELVRRAERAGEPSVIARARERRSRLSS